jgi:hypothetical protein
MTNLSPGKDFSNSYILVLYRKSVLFSFLKLNKKSKVCWQFLLFPCRLTMQYWQSRKERKMISARNHFHGNVKEIRKGAVNGIVKLETPGGNLVSATISMEAIEDLKLAEGKRACIFVKATEVMLANDTLKISARNQWKGTVKEIKDGAVNAIVKLEIEAGVIITSTISMEAVKDLGLTVGAKAIAIVKSTSVMLGEE